MTSQVYDIRMKGFWVNIPMVMTVIKQKLETDNFFAQTDDNGVYQLKLDEHKIYKITKVSETEVKVIRDSEYEVTTCCDSIRTAVASLFSRTNRCYIKKVLEADMSYFDRTSFSSAAAQISEEESLSTSLSEDDSDSLRSHVRSKQVPSAISLDEELLESSEDEDDDTKPLLNSKVVSKKKPVSTSVHSRAAYPEQAASNPIRIMNSCSVDTEPLSKTTNRDFFEDSPIGDGSELDVGASSAGVLDSLHLSGCFERILHCYGSETEKSTEKLTEDTVGVKNRKQQVQQLPLQQPSFGGQKVLDTLKHEKIEAFESVLKESRKKVLPKGYGARENEAAREFQVAYRGYKDRQAQAKQTREVNVFGRYTMQHPTKKDHLGNPLLYYFDKEGISKPVRRPLKSRMFPQDFEKGSLKELRAKDKVSVELGTIKRSGRYTVDSHEYKEIAQHLAPYPSCCPSMPVDDKTIIAKNGGENMRQMILNGKRVDLKCFKGACKDMARMHRRRIYLRDIKLENMTLSSNKHALFIDTDDTAVPTLDNYRQFKGTTAMTTQKLIEQKRAGKLEFIEADSNYAMLLLMTEATSEALRGQKETQDTAGGVAFKISRVNANNRELYRNWVDAHVKAEYKDKVMSFLSNPAKNRLDTDIIDVMDWSR